MYTKKYARKKRWQLMWCSKSLWKWMETCACWNWWVNTRKIYKRNSTKYIYIYTHTCISYNIKAAILSAWSSWPTAIKLHNRFLVFCLNIKHMFGYITMLLHDMIHFRHFTHIYYICIRTIKPFMRTYFISHLWVK